MISQSKFRNNIPSRITLIDGIAIFFIVLFHELGGINRPDSIFLNKYLAIFGLVLFTFSSGFKIAFNHSDEINSKSFISKYFTKRFIRLYKAYIGYTLFAFVPLYFINYLSLHYLKLNFEGLTKFWDHLNINDLFQILIGNNFIAYQLWYLLSLLIVTTVCFTILYYFRINTLFYFSPLLILFDVIYWDNLKICPHILFNAMVYMPIYIFGIFYGYYGLDNNKLPLYICSIIFTILFFVSIIYPEYNLFKYSIMLYGLT